MVVMVVLMVVVVMVMRLKGVATELLHTWNPCSHSLICAGAVPPACADESSIACPFLSALSLPAFPSLQWGGGKYTYLPAEPESLQLRHGLTSVYHAGGSPVVRSVGQCAMLTLPLSQCLSLTQPLLTQSPPSSPWGLRS